MDRDHRRKQRKLSEIQVRLREQQYAIDHAEELRQLEVNRRRAPMSPPEYEMQIAGWRRAGDREIEPQVFEGADGKDEMEEVIEIHSSGSEGSEVEIIEIHPDGDEGSEHAHGVNPALGRPYEFYTGRDGCRFDHSLNPPAPYVPTGYEVQTVPFDSSDMFDPEPYFPGAPGYAYESGSEVPSPEPPYEGSYDPGGDDAAYESDYGYEVLSPHDLADDDEDNDAPHQNPHDMPYEPGSDGAYLYDYHPDIAKGG